VNLRDIHAKGEWRPSVAEERQVEGVQYFTQKEGCKGTERASVLSMLFQSKREREWWAGGPPLSRRRIVGCKKRL